MALTIYDIAKKAGVSKSTVSRVLNKTGYISEKTKKNVEEVIKNNKYIPSAMARSLSKRESNTIGVIIPEADNAFFGEILKGISEVVDKYNMTLIFCDTGNSPEKEERALNMLKEHRVKGLILTPANDYSDEGAAKRLRKQLRDLMVPVVLLDREVENSLWDGVYFENFKSAYSATEVLISEGNKKIGIITGDLNIKIGRDRYHGYLQAMEDNDMPVEDKYILEGNFSTNKAYQLMKECIEKGDIPDAILTCNNRTTLGFLKAIGEKKLVVGRDIAAIGIDHNEVLDILDYSFSYVERDTIETGRKATYMLLERIDNPDEEIDICIMPFKIVLKGSEKKKK